MNESQQFKDPVPRGPDNLEDNPHSTNTYSVIRFQLVAQAGSKCPMPPPSRFHRTKGTKPGTEAILLKDAPILAPLGPSN